MRPTGGIALLTLLCSIAISYAGSVKTSTAPALAPAPASAHHPETYVVPSTPLGSHSVSSPTYAPGGHAVIPTVGTPTFSPSFSSGATSAPLQTSVGTVGQAPPANSGRLQFTPVTPPAASATQYFTTPSGAVVNASTGQLVSPPPPNWSASPVTSPSAVRANVLPAPSGNLAVAMPAGNPLLIGSPVGQNPIGSKPSATTSTAFPPLGSSGIANTTPALTPNQLQPRTPNASPGASNGSQIGQAKGNKSNPALASNVATISTWSVTPTVKA